MSKNSLKTEKKANAVKQTVVDTATDTASEKAKLRRNNFIAKIFCVLGALIIWLYVMDQDSPDYQQTFYDVPVTLTNTTVLENQNGLSVYSGYGLTVDVTVNGKKSVINKISSDNFTASADVGSLTEAGTYSVTVSVALPSGLSLVSLSQNDVEIYADIKGSVAVPVEVRITNFIVEGGNSLGEPKPEYSQIIVTGPQTVLDTISTAIITLDIGKISSSVTASGKVVLYNSDADQITNPYIKLSRSEISVVVPVYKYKDVPLTVAFKYGYFNSNNVNITIEPDNIELRGDPELIDAIDSLTVTTIDEKSIIEDESRLVTLDMPDGLESVDSIETVTVDIVHKNTIIRKIVINDITVVGVPDGLTYELLSDSVTVSLRGTIEALRTVGTSDISATVDLSGYTGETSGTVTENVEITINTDENIYEVGSYTIQVTLGNA